MGVTKIPYLTRTWNVTDGCSPVSEGCERCYARRWQRRFLHGEARQGVTCRPDKLEELRSWTFPQVVGVCFMSDLFHPDVPWSFLDDVFAEMLRPTAARHTFLLLTKRIKNAAAYWGSRGDTAKMLRHIWMGVTAENAALWRARVPMLMAIPAAVRWVSVEPMLGPLDLAAAGGKTDATLLRWVVCGAETGPGARAMEPEWAEELAAWCHTEGVPFYFKQASKTRRLPWCAKIRQIPESFVNGH